MSRDRMRSHEDGRSIIDHLIDTGNWHLHFLHNRFGYRVIVLLPYFCERDEEKEENDALIELIDGIDEEIFILDQFLKENPQTPFIISEYSFDKCKESMKERLNECIKGEDYSKFNKEYDKYCDFRKAVRYIEAGGTQRVFDAFYNGWQIFKNKESNDE